MAPCSGSKAAIVLRPANKKRPPQRGDAGAARQTGYALSTARGPESTSTVTTWFRSGPVQIRSCGGSTAARLYAASLKVWFAMFVAHSFFQHGEHFHDLLMRIFIGDDLANQQRFDLGARKRWQATCVAHEQHVDVAGHHVAAVDGDCVALPVDDVVATLDPAAISLVSKRSTGCTCPVSHRTIRPSSVRPISSVVRGGDAASFGGFGARGRLLGVFMAARPAGAPARGSRAALRTR